MVFWFAIILRFLTANSCRHGWSKVMRLLSWSTTWCILLAMTINLLLESHHIRNMIIVHVLWRWCQSLPLAIAAHSALMVLWHWPRCRSIDSSSTTNTSAIIIGTRWARSAGQLLTCRKHLFLPAIMMLHHLLGLARWWYPICRTLPALVLTTSFTYESCLSRRRG